MSVGEFQLVTRVNNINSHSPDYSNEFDNSDNVVTKIVWFTERDRIGEDVR